MLPTSSIVIGMRAICKLGEKAVEKFRSINVGSIVVHKELPMIDSMLRLISPYGSSNRQELAVTAGE